MSATMRRTARLVGGGLPVAAPLHAPTGWLPPAPPGSLPPGIQVVVIIDSDHLDVEVLLRAARQVGDAVDARLALAGAEVEGLDRVDRGLARYAAIAGTPGHAPEHRAAAAEGRAVALLLGRGDTIGARRVAQAAHLAFPGEVAGVRAGALSAFLDVLCGDVEEGVAAAARLPDLGDRVIGDVVLSVQAYALTVSGDLEAAAVILTRLHDQRRVPSCGVPDHRLPLWAALAGDLATSLLDLASGRMAAARAGAVGARIGAQERGSRALIAAWDTVLAHLAIVAGDLATAERHAIDAEVAAGSHDPCGIRSIARYQQALVAAQRGAVHVADDLLGLVDADGAGVHRWLEVERCRVLAWNEHAGGRSRSAAQLAVEAGEVAIACGRPLDAAIAFVDAVRFGSPDLALTGFERLGRNDALRPNTLTERLARFAHAAAAGDADRLGKVGDDLLEAGLRSLAVEAWLAAAAHATDPRP